MHGSIPTALLGTHAAIRGSYEPWRVEPLSGKLRRGCAFEYILNSLFTLESFGLRTSSRPAGKELMDRWILIIASISSKPNGGSASHVRELQTPADKSGDVENTSSLPVLSAALIGNASMAALAEAFQRRARSKRTQVGA